MRFCFRVAVHGLAKVHAADGLEAVGGHIAAHEDGFAEREARVHHFVSHLGRDRRAARSI